ncbi:choline BCCT transporter BetT [Pusillimonas sp. CC-YST705]|uniref:Choline BCCT transporter BetT n=1 Tax=Mesopusillimonas faecipullorum TaxID=2755040 RepID=A0ABS8CAI7_9BURK|nr:choline BCCT transporter BetT [Mesopusillimonas faecipullorum]MCB5363048.1 choline BCCT transporter BetT [Mesopusillimonas faecipullorum]
MTEDSSKRPHFLSRVHPPVFYPATGILLALALLASVFRDEAQTVFAAVQGWIVTNVGWVYILVVALILLVTIYCMVSRIGNIKLGPDHSKPDYTNSTWFAMLFCAGMGIGLMFFGVAEPLMHMLSPPVGEGGTAAAAREAIKITFFHWGLHAWAIYAIVALILALFAYRHGLPLTLRSALYPLIGERIYGPIGHMVDVFAVVSTVLGVATSLGFGVLQMNAGLQFLFGIEISIGVQVILIIIATALATMSVMVGLDKGIRRLSEFNMILAVLLLLFVLVMGPTVFLLQAYVQNTGAYLSQLVQKTFNLYAYNHSDWLGGWTLFYWGWWLSWSPFVGMFIARISRGRSIREFLGGMLFVPVGFTFLWMTVFGDSAIDLVLGEGVTELAEITQKDSSLALFVFLQQFPFSEVMSGLAITMVLVFFVTSADSGALVVDMLASGGRENTFAWQRLFWSIGIGAMAIALLLADGLQALQTATLASALPFSLVLVAAVWGLLKALQADVTKYTTNDVVPLSRPSSGDGGDWHARLRGMMSFPRRAHVQRFIEEVVQPACQEVVEELAKQGVQAEFRSGKDGMVGFQVMHDKEVDFIYEVHPRAYLQPSFIGSPTNTAEDSEDNEARKYFRAEVYLKEGGQNYDIMGWRRQDVINDILDQYERHLHFLHLLR